MSNDSTKRTILVALGVCLVCSILVSTATVGLKSIQEENKKLDKIKNILIAGQLLTEGRGVEEIYNEKVTPILIDLATGDRLPQEKFDAVLNPAEFNIKSVASDPRYSKLIPADQDRAQIKRMPKYSVIYQVKEANVIQEIILPVYGKGLWSTMYGFMALGNDLRTIKGFTFYEHGETPGLGGEVDNPNWKNIWKGKQAFDENGSLRITVIKGRVDKNKSEAIYQVDGLSGSTLTTRGVDNLVKFWLGPDGYGPFLKNLASRIN